MNIQCKIVIGGAGGAFSLVLATPSPGLGGSGPLLTSKQNLLETMPVWLYVSSEQRSRSRGFPCREQEQHEAAMAAEAAAHARADAADAALRAERTIAALQASKYQEQLHTCALAAAVSSES